MSAAVIVVLAPTALFVGMEPILVIPLVIAGLVVAIIRLLRRPPHGKRLPDRPTYRVHDADTLRESTKAMLKRWQKAAEGLSASESVAPAPHQQPSPANPDGQP